MHCANEVALPVADHAVKKFAFHKLFLPQGDADKKAGS
jgi:hypothetical protein